MSRFVVVVFFLSVTTVQHRKRKGSSCVWCWAGIKDFLSGLGGWGGGKGGGG